MSGFFCHFSMPGFGMMQHGWRNAFMEWGDEEHVNMPQQIMRMYHGRNGNYISCIGRYFADGNFGIQVLIRIRQYHFFIRHRMNRKYANPIADTVFTGIFACADMVDVVQIFYTKQWRSAIS